MSVSQAQELMRHSTITMTTRYAHLSPAHLREAVNKASLNQAGAKTGNETVTATVTKENQPITRQKEGTAEALDELVEVGGGAERVRTAASQFCRLLP